MNAKFVLVNYLLALLSSNGIALTQEILNSALLFLLRLLTQFVTDGIKITLITHCDSVVSLSLLSRLIRSFSRLLPIIS